MIRGTTPTLILRIPIEGGLGFASRILVTLAQWGTTLTKELGDDVVLEPEEGQLLSVYLSQEETLMFKPKVDTEVQVNWIASDGTRGATKIKKIDIYQNMVSEVIDP